MNGFFDFQSSPCQQYWIFLSRALNSCSCLTYSDNASTFDELLEINDSISFYQVNLESLDIVQYHMVDDLFPEVIRDFLDHSASCNTKNRWTYHSVLVKSLKFSAESFFHPSSKIWNIVPEEMENLLLVACRKFCKFY